MELEIYIKQATQYNSLNQVGIYQGANPQSLNFVPNGILASNRQINGYPNYINVTTDVSDIFKLQLTWTTDYEPLQSFNTDSLPKKSASGILTFEGDAYQYIKKWLIDDVSAPYNAISVKIKHVGCGTYEDYQITGKDLIWCDAPNVNCSFDITLKQADRVYDCFEKTLISDNWQGWFQDQPTNGKKHPRFSYCNEQRPNGLLIAIWVVLSIVFTVLSLLAIVLVPIINIIILIILGIVTVINIIIAAINLIPGINIDPIPTSNLQPITFDDIFDSFAAVFLESAGCGREHPAPLVRDYIQNVCSKCGITVTPDTAPVFFSTVIKINSNADGDKTVANPHYNACYFNEPVQRGIRRFSDIGLFDGVTINKTDYYIYDNRPLLTGDLFCDQLGKLYNTRWYIKTYNGQPTLFIQRKDLTINTQYLYDFSPSSPDYDKLNSGICYEFNDRKYPAATEGLYVKDPTDKPANESLKYFNDIISHGLTDNNPNYKGINDKTSEFGGTKFRLDGASEDYLYGAFQIMLTINGLILPFVNALFIPVRNRIAEMIEVYADYALLMEGETAIAPKILIWDSTGGYENARAQKYGSCVPIANYAQPNPNLNYNTQTWQPVHPPITKVAGSQFSIGYYHVQNIFNTYSITKPALIINFPMIMGVGFKDTMWDWWHWIDDPAKNPLPNRSFAAKIYLCCPDLQLLGVFGDINNIKLLQKVKLPLGFYSDGIIKEITVSYDPTTEDGQFIEIKGDV